MTKHPIIAAFVTALVLSVVLALVVPYTAQESPWALSFIVVLFPFIWFFAWLIINAFAWWQDTPAAGKRPGNADETQAPPH
jgi:protein-S-isoprenylcysteine O-methyltransferase Ste14